MTEVGQHHQVAHQPEAAVQHLGDAGAVGREVVEQEDALGEHHGARRRREPALALAQAHQAEQLHPVQERDHVAAHDHHRLDVVQDRRQLFAVPGDGGALEGAPAIGELVVLDLTALEVVAVELLQRLDRLDLLFSQELGVDVPHGDGARSLELVVETDAVEIVHQPEAPLLGLVRGGEGLVFGKHLFRPGVQGQVHRLHAQALDQGLVVALALLPARGDQRHRALHVGQGQRRADVGRGLLRAEKHDGRHAQLAHTFTV